MLLADIQQSILTSLKAGDHVRVDTMRFLLSAVKNAGIAKYGAEFEKKLTDGDVLDVVKKQVKSHRESIEIFSRAGREELVKRESDQLVILEAMLPAEMPDDELKKLLLEVVGTKETNFGKLMSMAMAKVNGKASGARVSAMLKELTT